MPVSAFAAPAAVVAKAPATSSDSAGNDDQKQIQALIDAISNDATRAKLIDALKKTTAEPAPPAPTPAPDEDVSSVGRRIAEFTQSVAQNTATSAKAFAAQLAAAPARLSALGPDQMDVVIQAVWDVALAIVTTYAIFLVLRWLSIGLFKRMGRYAHDHGVLRKIFLILVSALIDVAVVLLAWTAGYLITLTAFGQFGTIGLRQSLYLNAFVLVELFRVVLRIVLSPATGELRLINISDRAAQLLNNRMAWIAAILGYGQLFVAPILNQSVSPAAGQAASAILALIALVIALSLTIRNRQSVRTWLLGETTDTRAPSRFALFLARNWYWAVLVYFAFIFVVVVTEPAENLLPILGATGEVIIALIIGLGITGWIAKTSRRGVRLPESLKQKLPLLEARLNAFIPRMLTFVRIFVLLALIGFTLHVIGLFNVSSWMNSQFGARATGAIVAVFAILVVNFAVWLALDSWVDYRLNPDFGSVPTSRERTLLTLLRNAVTIAIVVITLMFVLSEIGINIAPLIASAGVFGLAIGFGAQKLVQDIITGVFIQLENAINVGDVVTAGGVTGTAERLTIRSLSIRDLDGTFHIIPFSSVDAVSNFMKGFSYSVCSLGVGYREDYDEVRGAMFEAFEMLRKDPEHGVGIIGDMAWDGITQFADSAIIVRCRIKTVAGKQWAIGRAYNTYLKKVFDARDIDMPVPQRTILFGRDKKGNAPPVHVRVAEEEKTEGIPAVVVAPPYGADGKSDADGNR
ncbi:MAG: mechanosensitive ion channel domain-containing protein [Pararhizobium sp.]